MIEKLDVEGRGPSDAILPMLADCERVEFLRDPGSGARAIVVVHDSSLGPAFGGIRRLRYADVAAAAADVVRLARAMTFKCAMAEVPAGGGKAVILDGPDVDRRAAYELVGDAVARLGGLFHTGPDVGTTLADLRVVRTRTRHCAGEAHGDLGGSTARGVLAAAQATAAHAGFAVAGASALVQGLGAVGMPLCRLLHEQGARLLVADPDAAAVEHAAAAFGAVAVDPGLVATTECDLLLPCALGGWLDEATAKALPVRAVCGAANNLLQDDAAGAVLHARGIPVAPDFVANAGGLIHGVMVELFGEPPNAARFERIGAVTARLLADSRQAGLPPGQVAFAEAARRVQAARGLR